MNVPYQKIYNQDGVLTNPIEKSYLTDFPEQNRQARRAPKQKKSFYGE